MDSSLSDKLEKLLKSGKITEEEKAELEKAIFGSSSAEETPQTEKQNIPNHLDTVEIRQFLHADIEINEGSAFNIISGKENLVIEQENNTVTIKPKRPRNNILGSFLHTISASEKIVITVPKNTRLKIRAVSSDIRINNVQGDISINTVSGDIEITENALAENTLHIDISTISGDLTLQGVNAMLNAKTKSGDLSIKNSKISGTIKLYSGDIKIKKTEFAENTSIKTFSGDIEIDGVAIKGETEIETFHGDIDVAVKNNDVSVYAESKSGDVYIDKALKKTSGHPLKVVTKRGDIKIKQNGGAL